MPHDHDHDRDIEVKLSGNVGVFGKIEHVHTVNIVLPPGVQAQLDRMEAQLDSIEKKIDDCCAPSEAEHLVIHVGTPTEQP